MARKKKRVFAVLGLDGRVQELITEREDIAQEWHPDVLFKHGVEVTDRPEVKVGWVRDENGQLQAPKPFVPTPHQKRNGAFHAGPRVKGKRGPAARFKMSAEDWARMSDVAQHVVLFKEFPGGAKTYRWPSDPPTTFNDPDEFVDVFKSVAAWRDRWNQHVDGDGDEPSGDVTV